MITKSNSYKTEDGQLFASENEAKLHELEVSLNSTGADADSVTTAIRVIEAHLETVIQIMTGSVRVRGKYNRKAKTTPAEPKAKA